MVIINFFFFLLIVYLFLILLNRHVFQANWGQKHWKWHVSTARYSRSRIRKSCNVLMKNPDYGKGRGVSAWHKSLAPIHHPHQGVLYGLLLITAFIITHLLKIIIFSTLFLIITARLQLTYGSTAFLAILETAKIENW